MTIPVEMPLDGDGFLRRECPHCEQEFKWHHGPTEEAPPDLAPVDVYWCPRCGQSAPVDQWWTKEQLDYAERFAAGPAFDMVVDQLRSTLKQPRGSFFKIDVKPGERPGVPDPLVELDDMAVISPPCHPWEPIKVPEAAQPPYYCLLCGEPFAA
jgi:hypothetical protein